jgi:hypothetical protein
MLPSYPRVEPLPEPSRLTGAAEVPWRRRVAGEPPLEELLEDPIMDMLLQSDRVAPGVLDELIASKQASLQRNPSCILPWGAGLFL